MQASQNINFNKNFIFQVRKIKLHTIIGEGLTGELLSTFVKTDTICSGLRNNLLVPVQGSNPMVEQANKAKR